MKKLLILPLLCAISSCTVYTGSNYEPPPQSDCYPTYRVVWVEYYGCPPAWIDDCCALGWSEDDVAVALFLCHHARCEMRTVIELRSTRLTWWDVTARLRLEPTIYYVAVSDDVAVSGPYGHAYGYFRRRDPHYVFADADIGNLVHLRVTSDYYKLDPATVIRHRESGQSFRVIADEHHGKSKGHDVRGNAVKQARPEKPIEVRKTTENPEEKPKTIEKEKPKEKEIEKPRVNESEKEKSKEREKEKPRTNEKEKEIEKEKSKEKEKEKPKEKDQPNR